MNLLFIDNFESLKDYSFVSGVPAAFSNNQYLVSNASKSVLGQVIPQQQTVCQTFDLEVTGLVGGPTENAIAVLRDGSTDQLVLLLNNTGTLEVKRGNTSLGTSSFVFQNGVQYTIAFKATIDDTNGYFSVLVDGTPVLSALAIDTKNGSTTLVNTLILGLANASNYWGGSWTMRFSNYHISLDFIPMGSVVLSQYPLADGSITEFTPSSGTNWEAVLTDDGDASYVFTDSPAQDLYEFEDLPVDVTAINAVQINIIARKDGSGAASITPLIGDYDGLTVPVFSSYTSIRQLFNEDPETTQSWVPTGFNDTEFGFLGANMLRVTQAKVKISTLGAPPVLRVTQQKILASVQQGDLENRITSIQVKVSCQKS